MVDRGGMGVVYRATDLRLDRPVALKLVAPELAGDERFRSRFLKEPRLAAALDHPNVVPIYEAGEHDGRLFLAMRFVPGQQPQDAAGTGGGPRARASAGDPGAGRRCARRGASAGAGAPGRQAGQRAARRGRATPIWSTSGSPSRSAAIRRRPGRSSARSTIWRRSRSGASRSTGGPTVRARVRALRVPGGHAAVSPRHPDGGDVGASAGAAAAAGEPPASSIRWSRRRWPRSARGATRPAWS